MGLQQSQIRQEVMRRVNPPKRRFNVGAMREQAVTNGFRSSFSTLKMLGIFRLDIYKRV